MDFRSEIRQVTAGEILENEPLSRHTSFGIGGPADYLVRPKTEGELTVVLKLTHAHGLPLMVIGRGTNLLVGDRGVRGVVVDLSQACRRLEKVAGGAAVGSGITVTEVLEFCYRNNLGGLEFMAGIPGSLGGAVMVNAGAWDQALGDHIRQVRGYTPSGKTVILDSSSVQFSYRWSNLPRDLIVTEVQLTLAFKEEKAIREQMEEYRHRRRHQPADQRSAGSVFKNPPSAPAGRLIEQAGCKGMRVNGAQVSPRHANFIVNLGGASAAAVKELIDKVRQRVLERFGVDLEMEIICVGDD